MGKAGFIRGRHFTEYADDVRNLLRDGEDDTAETLLLALVDATEEEAKVEGWCVAPWYYAQLASLYAKRKDHARELRVLERYGAVPHHQGGNGDLLTRLEQARRGSMSVKSERVDATSRN
jgi:hypothetical protein